MRKLLALTATIATAVAAFTGAARAATSDISSNWSGFAVGGTTFSSVSGSWVQPKATCYRQHHLGRVLGRARR